MRAQRNLFGSLKKTCDITIYRIEPWHDSPLQFQKMGASRSIERTFVSGRNTGACRTRCELNGRFISQLSQSQFRFRYIFRGEQNIKVAELACGNIAVQSLGQGRPLERHSDDSMTFKMLQNANQFAGKPQGVARIFLILGAQHREISNRQLFGIRRQRAMNLRNYSMVLGKADEGFPIGPAAQKFFQPIAV
jgi:hypothetical protein